MLHQLPNHEPYVPDLLANALSSEGGSHAAVSRAWPVLGRLPKGDLRSAGTGEPGPLMDQYLHRP